MANCECHTFATSGEITMYQPYIVTTIRILLYKMYVSKSHFYESRVHANPFMVVLVNKVHGKCAVNLCRN